MENHAGDVEAGIKMHHLAGDRARIIAHQHHRRTPHLTSFNPSPQGALRFFQNARCLRPLESQLRRLISLRHRQNANSFFGSVGLLLLGGDAVEAFLRAFELRIGIKRGAEIVECLAILADGLIGLGSAGQGDRVASLFPQR
jgi:hypothetical protein